jgi:NhaP-type Na+/H+ or K+/H+ antiporter
VARVAALFYANFSVGEAGMEEAWVVGSLIICASVLVHGLSATPLARLYGRHVQNDGSRELGSERQAETIPLLNFGERSFHALG